MAVLSAATKNRLKNISALLISAFVCLILLELLFRAFDFPPPHYSGWKSNNKKEELNQLGFRGQIINYSDNDFVILLLGDSQVQAGVCSFSMMPEKRLEHYLQQIPGITKKIKVFTVGTGGYGQDQEFLMLKEYYKKFRADMVVLWLTPHNDIRDNVFPSHWPTNGAPKPTYWIKNDTLMGPSEQPGDIVHEERLKLYALLNRTLIKLGVRKKPTSMRRDDQWDAFLPKPYQPLQNYSGLVKTDWQEAWDKNIDVDGYVKDDNLENDKNRFNEYLTPTGDRTRYGLDLTRRLLDSIRITVEKHKGNFSIFFTQIPVHNNDKCLQDGVYSLNGKNYRISNAQYQENLDFVTKGFTFFPIPVAVKDWRVGYNNAHLNEKTNDIVMRDLADTIKYLVLHKMK